MRPFTYKRYKCIPLECKNNIVGVDEAGRGALAGPVVVVACYVLIAHDKNKSIRDSKKIPESERCKIYKNIIQDPTVYYEYISIGSTVIDNINIWQATAKGMRESVELLYSRLRKKLLKCEGVIVDGPNNPNIPVQVPVKCIIKADDNVYVVQMASIIATVIRDNLMIQYDNVYKGYHFARNKGYPTKYHTNKIIKYGPIDIHRRTFGEVKTLYESHSANKTITQTKITDYFKSKIKCEQ